MNRRKFLGSSLKTSALLYGTLSLGGHMGLAAPQRQTRRGRQIIASESGDPDLPPEVLKTPLAPIIELYSAPVVRGIRKDPTTMAEKTLEVAKTYIGVSRSSHPDQVDKFLNLFGLHIKYPNGVFVPYCASGLAYAACHAYSLIAPPEDFDPDSPVSSFKRVLPDLKRYYYLPSPACRIMVGDARKRGTWLPRSQSSVDAIRPGWIVFFDWKMVGKADHVGIVNRAETGVLHTVEFNTSIRHGSQSNGGAVAARERQYRYVLGYIKTH